MTKLKLNLAHGAGEILTREELKKVLGGTGSGSGSGSGSDDCEDQKGNACSTGTCSPEVYFNPDGSENRRSRVCTSYKKETIIKGLFTTGCTCV